MYNAKKQKRKQVNKQMIAQDRYVNTMKNAKITTHKKCNTDFGILKTIRTVTI